MSKKHESAEDLWQRILATQSLSQWMVLTQQFNLYRIYDHFRILQDPQRIETYRCRLMRAYMLSLDAYDASNPKAPCFMMLENGNLRRSSSPSDFDFMLGEGMRSAANDGPYIEEEEVNDSSEAASEASPAVVQIAAILEILSQLGVDYKTCDKSKIIALICILTGRGSAYISKKVYDGFCITKRHLPFVSVINKAFEDLKLNISIKNDKDY